ncbi:Putative secreted protein OS=Rhodopirellula sp. SWK7 GN=RRSWK_05138 PE=4 SV=1 [Gemmata massiliana]|uniref:Carboxypeptidase regulatory-like domain-containing protein n=1 Tax=Gemmata massiliana TaxID=1210884 RepID=A0A6P2CVL4_9BACT|nr:hypothetical protein [Gemmata massiliana]VTR92426.1 Putative secreted protein OS=Rhodopirellula sp. SWK7 GN=RRSWK_05138 PE=4 SV=1 [Gemmata massiliana]
MASRFVLLRAGVLVAIVGATGCDRGPQLAEVEGVITCSGRPLANVEVVFLPDPEQGTSGPRSSGYTDNTGRYRLTAPGGDGAVAGTHRVAVRDLTMIRGPFTATGSPAISPAAPKTRFTETYLSSSTTPLKTVKVQPGRNVLNFELTSPGK